jgi:plasmid stability protein
MSKTVQIRDLDEETYQVLRKRAADAACHLRATCDAS